MGARAGLGFHIKFRCIGTTSFTETKSGNLHYGHNSADARRPALIIDGFFDKEALQWLYFDEAPATEPKLEPICQHGTEW